MWRLLSFTYWFSVIILGVAIVAPFNLDDRSRNIIFGLVLPFIILREKTQLKIKRG
jgi:hypothetical protein